MSVLTVSDILTFCRNRLEANYIDTALYDANDVLELLSDAYRDACEASQCLQTLFLLAATADVTEYGLPANFSQVISVAAGGKQLQPISLHEAQLNYPQSGVADSFYVYGTDTLTTIGIIPTPSADSQQTVLILYAETPDSFANFGDTLDPRFPTEYVDMLVHYVYWRVQLLSGGAERSNSAQLNRTMYEGRLKAMRRQNRAISNVGPGQLTHVSDRRKVMGNVTTR